MLKLEINALRISAFLKHIKYRQHRETKKQGCKQFAVLFELRDPHAEEINHSKSK